MWARPLKFVAAGVIGVVLTVVAVAALPAIKSFMGADKAGAQTPRKKPPIPAELIRSADGHDGLRLTAAVIRGLRIKTELAKAADQSRALPVQLGTTNYDNEGLFAIKSRFAGEVAQIHKVRDTGGILVPSQFRPVRYGDKVSQGELLAVVWSRDLGEKKAALVDALSALSLSEDLLRRQAKLFQEGAISEATYRTQARQVAQDTNNVLTAERTLKMWKLTDREINETKDEAKKIIQMLKEKKKRDPETEKNWARVEIRAPVFSEIPDPDNPGKLIPDPKQMLTIVEKNTNVNDMVDPTTIMFKLADLTRLQIWVNIHEELLASLRRGQKEPSQPKLTWKVQIENNPTPLELPIAQVAPSLDPNTHTLTALGYLPNPDMKYRVGQFVKATIYVKPERDTVEIPTNALNEVEAEALVFVQPDAAKPEFMLRRVAVVHRFKDVSYVRSKLTEQDKNTSADEVKKGKRPIQPLLPGERVVTRPVELTAALDDLVNKARIERAGKK
jgi:membrane fusion protein, heavy metal efflux system